MTNLLEFAKTALSKFLVFIKTSYDVVKLFFQLFFKELGFNFTEQKKKWQSAIDLMTNTASATQTFFTTLNTSLKVVPIIFSILAVLSTVPLLHFALPSIIVEPLVIYPVLLGISIYAGYSTYKDLVERARLDALIEVNAAENKKLNDKIQTLEKTLKNLTQGASNDAVVAVDKSYIVRERPKTADVASPQGDPALVRMSTRNV